jgi:hypothetical protein
MSGFAAPKNNALMLNMVMLGVATLTPTNGINEL